MLGFLTFWFAFVLFLVIELLAMIPFGGCCCCAWIAVLTYYRQWLSDSVQWKASKAICGDVQFGRLLLLWHAKAINCELPSECRAPMNLPRPLGFRNYWNLLDHDPSDSLLGHIRSTVFLRLVQAQQRTSEICGDCVFVSCCTCCAIAQESRHVEMAATVNHEAGRGRANIAGPWKVSLA